MNAADMEALFTDRLAAAEARWRELRRIKGQDRPRQRILEVGRECARLTELLDAARALLAAERDRARLEAAAAELLK